MQIISSGKGNVGQADDESQEEIRHNLCGSFSAKVRQGLTCQGVVRVQSGRYTNALLSIHSCTTQYEASAP